jgi:hypothetical protein
MFVQANATKLPFADKTFDLLFTSPPYTDARTYGIGAQRKCQAWVSWMLKVVAECVRVTKGLVLINCAGVTRDWCYQPGPEGLLYEWWKQGGRCWRPAYWHRVGIPGSGGKQWLRADIEYVLAFTDCEGMIPFADNTANGHPPKWAPGGEMSYRLVEGQRVNQWGGRPGKRITGGMGVKVDSKAGDCPSHKFETFRPRARRRYSAGRRVPAPNARQSRLSHQRHQGRWWADGAPPGTQERSSVPAQAGSVVHPWLVSTWWACP